MTKSEIKRLDALWSLKVKERAGNVCEYCLVPYGEVRLNSCHIIGRANRTLRWDLRNGLSLCYRHHRDYDTHQLNHEHIRHKLISKDRLDYLITKSRVIAKNQDYDAIKGEIEYGDNSYL